MPTTSQLRIAWKSPLVVSFTGPRCDWSKAVPVVFYAAGPYPGRVTLKVHPAARLAFKGLAAIMLAHRYAFTESAGGTLACRLITGGSATSLHAHGIAADSNPSRNGYRVVAGALDEPDTGHAEGLLQWGKYTDMPPAMVRAIERVRTAAGLRVFEWGGRWWNTKDPMHYELDRLPGELTAGLALDTVEGWTEYHNWLNTGQLPEEAPLPFLPLERGDGIGARAAKRSDVAIVQAFLNDAFGAALTVDGQYGATTAKAVARYLPDPAADGDDPGRVVTGNRYRRLHRALLDRAVATGVAAHLRAADHSPGGPGGVTTAQATAIANAAADDAITAHETAPVRDVHDHHHGRPA